jgi:DNA-binding GntR family transcriptional regulator
MPALLESKSLFRPLNPYFHPGDGNLKESSPENRVCNYVLDRIVTGEYSPGQRINEFEIARVLKLSKEQVREAMRNLIYLGLVERVPNKGVRMKCVTLADLEEIYEARQAIELEAIRKIAATITDEQLCQLQAVAKSCVFDQKLYDYTGQFAEIGKAKSADASQQLKNIFPYYDTPLKDNPDLQFHLLLVRFMGNRLWEQMALGIIPRAIILFQYYFFLLPHSIIRITFQHILDNVFALGIKPVPHDKIYQALAARDAARAEELMKEHLRFCYLINKAKIELYEEIMHDQKLHGSK